ncbi:N-acetyl-gamma-glutamyl-phosphate reductase [Stappia sp. ICDLI1TA098]|jgi:N-acetyl-gamma-glutamyl-phosphate reductase
MVAKVFIDGEAGTTGLQIRERLGRRRDIELLSVAPERRKDIGARAELLNSADVAILCLPDDAARESVKLIENDTTRVIDASSAHRVAEGWDYGFAEMAASQTAAIAASKRVTNPGCYPQGVIACIRPLIEAGLLPADFPVTVNAVSGYSGGGRQMIEAYEADGARNPAFLPYALTFRHKHLPEMTRYAGLASTPIFVPSVGNYAQGMVTAVPLRLETLARVPSAQELHAALDAHYRALEGSFVDVAPLGQADRVAELDPETFNGTNRMRLHVFASEDRAQVVLMAVYDNLGKGASGAAVQNLNLMLGVAADESLAA